MERFIERVLFASRWLLAPLYLGLALVLVLFVGAFFLELAHLVQSLLEGGEAHLTLAALKLLDLVLVASLVVMVMISGFENFVAKISLGADQQRLSWLTALDTGSIKVKILGSIAVISAIYLLEQLFDIEDVPEGKLLWLVVLQLTFVVSALLLAVLDRVGARRDGH
ncbi:MAG TPA: TIGR00645 family protein [Stellaceae bacterium]|nr:TIGR00645 family protein [Stellaceae bacterium]